MQPPDSPAFIGPLQDLSSRIRQAYGNPSGLPGHGIEALLEQLPYCVEGAVHHALNLVELQQKSTQAQTWTAEPQQARSYQLPEAIRQEMAFTIDAYLDAARRAQNAVWVLVSKVFRVSCPISLAEIVKRLERGRLSVPRGVRSVILKYWHDSGARLRDYRDLAQHYAVVASEAKVTIMPDGSRYAFLALPNNPEVKNAVLLRYSDPVVHAVPYVLESLGDLLGFVYELTHVLLAYTERPRYEVAFLTWKGGMSFGPGTAGHAPVSRAEIEQSVRTHLGAISASLEEIAPSDEWPMLRTREPWQPPDALPPVPQ